MLRKIWYGKYVTEGYIWMKEGSRVNTSMYERGNMYEYDRE